jgi:flagellar hook-associated protein 1 FlgK
MSILSALNIAVKAMEAQQKAIQTTGHNLANVDTPGFSRQRVELSSAAPSAEGPFSLGQGTVISGVKSLVSRFIEAELINLNSTLGSTEAQSQALAGVEQAFPVTGGIEAALDAFFAALSDLANNPAGQAERVSLIGKARALGDTLRQTRSVLTTLQSNLDKDLHAAVGRVNALLPQIATLNRQIAQSEAGGQPASDLRDQRQVFLQELSRLTGATVLEDQDGQVTALAGGLLLVGGDRAASLDDTTLSPTGFRLAYYKNPGGVSFDATSLFTKGEIGGLLTMRDTEVSNIIGRLDQLAKSLVDVVNAQHVLGFDLNGVAGGNFFNPIATVPGAAALVQVNSTVVANPNLIAAAQTAAGVPGDNGNALALVNLQTTAIVALGSTTLKNYFLSLVGDVGAKVQATEDSLNFQKSLLTQTQARRESVSGVNQDEEMTNLILFQRAFEAASLLVRTGDEMYQTILEMVR